MKADVRKGVGCVYIVIAAETQSERALLGLVAEKRDWQINAKTSMPLAGLLEVTEISLAPRVGPTVVP